MALWLKGCIALYGCMAVYSCTAVTRIIAEHGCKYREREKEREQTWTACALYKLFYFGLASAEGQKLECFQRTATNIFISTSNT